MQYTASGCLHGYNQCSILRARAGCCGACYKLCCSRFLWYHLQGLVLLVQSVAYIGAVSHGSHGVVSVCKHSPDTVCHPTWQ